MKPVLISSILFISMLSSAQIEIPRFDSRGNIQQKKAFDILQTKGGSLVNLKKDQKTLNVNTITHRDSSYYWIWDTTINNWHGEPRGKTVNYIYNSNDYIISLSYLDWNGLAWMPSGQYFFTYDASNNETSNYGQLWNGSAWMNGYKYSYSYDANNNQTSYLYQTGSGINWINSDQEFYTYDANNNRISFLSQTWNGSSWDNVSQNINTYDVNNNLAVQLHQNWNSSTWDNLFRITNSYDVNNNLINNLNENWNGSAWDSAMFVANTYDINNNLIGYESQLWNGSGWDNWQKNVKNYDVNNRIIYELQQNWSGITWENTTQGFYSHGANNAIITNCIYQKWDGINWVNFRKIDQPRDMNDYLPYEAFKDWNNPGTQIISGDSSYHYSNMISGMEEINASRSFDLSLYPNPSHSYLSVSTNMEYHFIKIITLYGQTVSTLENRPKLISVSDLSNGIYFIQILDKKGVVLKTEKFIKE